MSRSRINKRTDEELQRLIVRSWVFYQQPDVRAQAPEDGKAKARGDGAAHCNWLCCVPNASRLQKLGRGPCS